MAEFNGMTGRWVTTKDGRKVFIEDEPESAKTGVAFKIDTTKWSGNQSANDLMVAYLKEHKIPYKFNKYFELTADLNRDGNYKTLDYAGGGEVRIKGQEDLVDKQEREIAERQKIAKELNDEKKKAENSPYKNAPKLSEKALDKSYKDVEPDFKKALAYIKSDPEIKKAFMDKISRFAHGSPSFTQFVNFAIEQNKPKLIDDNAWGLWQFVRVYNDFISGVDTQQYLKKPHTW